MSDRGRALPPWMGKKEEKVKEKEPLKSRRKRKAARAAFYCMNEAELVEAAVSYLTHEAREDVALPTHQQVKEKAIGSSERREKSAATSQMTAKPVTEKTPSDEDEDDLDATYVSETDLDITEVETLPYTRSPQHPGSEGQRSAPVQDRGGLMDINVDIEERKERSQEKAAEEDDALRLVREIFFN